MAPIDPHSFADDDEPMTEHVSLSLYLDFSRSVIRGTAVVTLSRPHAGRITLDARALEIAAVVRPDGGAPIPFELSYPPDPIKGQALSVNLTSPSSAFVIAFSTSPSSTALQWLTPAQTSTKALPFVYTQCQAIHARSVFPCQDTPSARIRYSARLNIPEPLSAAMAAARVRRRAPILGEAAPGCPDAAWCAAGRAVEEFHMVQPVPPYLFAFAAGEIRRREVGPRSCVYAEGTAETVAAAAAEFAGVEDMIVAGEALFGEYQWERFDLLVLPPSFPYGGMENPRMTFLTPTVIRGDGSGAQVVAHELAHSWTGNLITNKTNNDFWLNEGFTTYAERRIVEVVQGKERAALNMGIGWRGLNKEMERFKNRMEFTKLKTNQEGVDPDEIYSEVPYEKGFHFLWRIEREIGRFEFDIFLKKYIEKFKFQSVDTETFVEFLKDNVPGIEKRVDIETWVHGTGIPADAKEPESALYTKIVAMAERFNHPELAAVAEWQGQEWELYLENLPRPLQPSQVVDLDTCFGLAESKDWEVKVAFLDLAISSGCEQYLGMVEKALKEVGRMKYLRPLYSALLRGPCQDQGKILAHRVFAEARDSYHPIAQGVVQSILSKHL
ncbi:peptidase M1 family protein [Wolffia australiana]